MLVWLPLIGLLIYDCVTYSTGHTKVNEHENCVNRTGSDEVQRNEFEGLLTRFRTGPKNGSQL